MLQFSTYFFTIFFESLNLIHNFLLLSITEISLEYDFFFHALCKNSEIFDSVCNDSYFFVYLFSY